MVRLLGRGRGGRGTLSKMSEEVVGWFDGGEELDEFDDAVADGVDPFSEEDGFGGDGAMVGFGGVPNRESQDACDVRACQKSPVVEINAAAVAKDDRRRPKATSSLHGSMNFTPLSVDGVPSDEGDLVVGVVQAIGAAVAEVRNIDLQWMQHQRSQRKA